MGKAAMGGHSHRQRITVVRRWFSLRGNDVIPQVILALLYAFIFAFSWWYVRTSHDGGMPRTSPICFDFLLMRMYSSYFLIPLVFIAPVLQLIWLQYYSVSDAANRLDPKALLASFRIAAFVSIYMASFIVLHHATVDFFSEGGTEASLVEYSRQQNFLSRILLIPLISALAKGYALGLFIAYTVFLAGFGYVMLCVVMSVGLRIYRGMIRDSRRMSMQ